MRFALWSGLGFYRRAQNIFKAKEVINSEHHGIFPKTFYELESFQELADQLLELLWQLLISSLTQY